MLNIFMSDPKNLVIALLVLVVVIQFLKGLKSMFKISYYETRLINNGIDVEHIKKMSLLKMFSC